MRSFCSSVPASLIASCAEVLHRDDQAARRADLRDLLDRDEGHQRALAGAAVLLAGEDPEDTVLTEQGDDVPRELGRAVDLGRARRDPLAGQRPHELPDLALLGRQPVVRHAASLEAPRGAPDSRPPAV